jgi:hypothetical protein
MEKLPVGLDKPHPQQYAAPANHGSGEPEMGPEFFEEYIGRDLCELENAQIPGQSHRIENM